MFCAGEVVSEDGLEVSHGGELADVVEQRGDLCFLIYRR